MARLLLALAVTLLLAACGGDRVYHHDEHFSAESSQRRSFATDKLTLCDASRHALMSQGYLVTRKEEGSEVALFGQKEFKEKENRHALLQIQAVCSASSQGAILFVTAVESHFDLAQTKEKTSVGLPLVAPISVTSTTTSEGQLKRSGETVSDRTFYEALFRAVERELASR